MSKRRKFQIKLLKGLLAASLIFSVLPLLGVAVSAVDAANNPTSRVYLRTNTRVYHHWILTMPGSSLKECHIYTVTHDQPGHEDVLGFCGSEVYQLWVDAPVCLEGTEGSEQCTGLVLHDIGEIEDRLKTTIWLPVAEVSIELMNCNPWENCESLPALKVTGHEPLRNHHIESVHIEFEDATGLVCRRTPLCKVDFPQTNQYGTDVILYVWSSYGDQSDAETFRVRNILQPDGTYQFQVLNTSWDYLAPPESVAWGIFPDLDITNAPWLLKTENVGDLATFHDYSLLAGRFILRGDVDISSCVYGGLTANGGATQCGMEQARDLVYQTQNQYDELTLIAALRTRIPPRIIKGVIAQESQFWPEWYFNGEYGLGMLTDEGIEMMLVWNPAAFLELCIPEYGADDCAWGYDSLGEYPQDYMRGLALSAVGTDQEVYRIAQTIVGAAAQSGQVIRNITRQEPYQVLSYQDMWKVTLGVYNSGVGCLYYAIDEAWDQDGRLNWGSISEYLIGDCQNAADYPNSVFINGIP
jgi:hypothetical protein